MANVNPTLDFTEDTERLVKQSIEDAKQAEVWENLDEKSITNEIFGVNQRITDAFNHLKRMVEDNDYENTDAMITALWIKDLSGEGWLRSFHRTNQSVFPAAANNSSKPGWYASLSSEKKKAYDVAQSYFQDTMWLLNVCNDCYEILRDLPLSYGFKLLRLKENFDEAGFTYELYHSIDDEMKSVSAQLAHTTDDLERTAYTATQFLKDNMGRLSKSDLSRGYVQARVKDYQEYIRTRGILQSFVPHSDGTYTIKSDMLAKLGVIDKYTEKMSEMGDFQDRLNKTMDMCKKTISGSLASAEKSCRTSSCKDLTAAFHFLLDAIMEFAQLSYDTFQYFRQESDGEPYCFMKKLSALNRVTEKYSFHPDTSSPWDSGTHFREMYQLAAKALGEHCKDFSSNHGHLDLM